MARGAQVAAICDAPAGERIDAVARLLGVGGFWVETIWTTESLSLDPPIRMWSGGVG